MPPACSSAPSAVRFEREEPTVMAVGIKLTYDDGLSAAFATSSGSFAVRAWARRKRAVLPF